MVKKNCHVKSYCSICAASHKTDECTNIEVHKCANCNENHKSTDVTCIVRKRYLEMRDKLSNKANHRAHKITSPINVQVNANNACSNAQAFGASHLSLIEFPQSKANALGVENIGNTRSLILWVEIFDRNYSDGTFILGGVFVVLLCGLALAVVVAILEFCWNSKKNAQTERQSLCSEMAEELRFAMHRNNVLQ